MKNKISLLLIILYSCFITSCDDNFNKSELLDSIENQISFDVTIENELETKGAPVISVDDESFNKVGVFGYHTENNFDNTENATSSYIPNIPIEKKTGKWGFKTNYFWPQKGYVTFFAYAPYDAEGVEIEDIQNGIPTLKYQVPQDITNQPDLMIAIPQTDLFRETVNFRFKHTLACIGINIFSTKDEIESIGIKGISTSATLTLECDDENIIWYDYSPKDDNIYNIAFSKDADQNYKTDGNGYLMLIPQTLEDEAYIIVKVKDQPDIEVPLKNLNTNEWEAGYKYMYNIGFSDQLFNVEVDKESCDFTGDTFNFTVSSSYITDNATLEPIGWTAEIVDESATDYSWLKISDLNDLTGGRNIKKSLLFPTSPFTSTSPEDEILKNSPENFSTIDLAYSGGNYNSANCYVINAPGWYKFPCCVMGNALKNAPSLIPNNDNCTSINTIFANEYFVNFENKKITDYESLKLSTTNTHPELLWEDAKNLISNIFLTGNGEYINFEVNKENIRQGNAVIAICNDEGTVMWSWHIWITPIVPAENNQIVDANFSIMKENIGYCSGRIIEYKERPVTIIFTQNKTGLTKTITLTQTGEVIEEDENSLYFQWGRKDPFVGAVDLNSDKKTYGSRPFILSASTDGVSIGTALQNPNIFYRSESNWNETPNGFLWGVTKEGNNETSNYNIHKSLYDPSPAGYMIMSNVVQKKLKEISKSYISADISKYEFDYHGNISYLKASGYRENISGVIRQNSIEGYYWSDLFSGNFLYNYIFFNNSDLSILQHNTSNGYSVCPMVEKN